LIVHRSNRPLRRLTAAAAVLGRGEQPEPVPENRPAELHVLAGTINQMTLDLSGLEADRALLFAGVSHDLRTPLSRLRLAVEMLPDDTVKPGTVQDIEDMDDIVGQFLAFVRDGEGEAKITANLNDIVREVRARYSRAGHPVETELGGLPLVPVRPTATQRLLSNLLDNALRCRRADEAPASVSVQTWQQGERVYLSVLDRGPGIPETEMARLKQRFARLRASRTAAASSGLGLAIVERIARGHGGRLWLQARTAGGLEARVELPV
jgi:two-component system osmolarity sensor histidine kinase EnvZ